MTEANVIVFLALAAFVPLALMALHHLGGRRGTLVALLGGWLFLPWFNSVGSAVPLLHTKQMFVPGIVLGVSLLLDSAAWVRLRPRLLDLPVAVVCLSPFLTSLVNGLGAYDGLASTFESTLSWGAPYLLGRAYLGSPSALLDAAKALVIAGLAYVPLCLWEIRMSPQLHRQAYGFHQHSFAQHVRDGHYRPMVFMAHGLMVGMFMASCTLVAFWLWRTRCLRSLGPFRLSWAFVALGATTVLCRSTGALVLLGIGIASLELGRRMRTAIPVLLLALAPTAYCGIRIANWDVMPMVTQADRWFGPARAESLRIRLVNEKELVAHDLGRPWLGWGKWNASRIRDEEGRDASIVDSLWIMTLGTSGLIGLIGVGMLLGLPVLLFPRAVPVSRWSQPVFAGAAALAVVVVTWTIDGLFNAMLAPIYPAIAGGLTSFHGLVVETQRRRRVAQRSGRAARVSADQLAG
jgi:hypothetical protein